MKEAVTTGEFLPFLETASRYLRTFPGERSSLSYALQVKFLDKYKDFVDDYNKQVNDKAEELRAKHCLKGKDGVFLDKEVKGDNGHVSFQKQFNESGETKFKEELNKFIDELKETKVEDFKPYKVELPSTLHITWYKEFIGFVFDELDEETEMKWYLAQAPEPAKEEKK